MEVDSSKPFVVKEINTGTDLMTKIKTKIKTNIVTKNGTEIDPFTRIGIRIDPTTKTKVD